MLSFQSAEQNHSDLMQTSDLLHFFLSEIFSWKDLNLSPTFSNVPSLSIYVTLTSDIIW